MRAHRLGLNLNTVAAATVPATKYAAIVATAAAGVGTALAVNMAPSTGTWYTVVSHMNPDVIALDENARLGHRSIVTVVEDITMGSTTTSRNDATVETLLVGETELMNATAPEAASAYRTISPTAAWYVGVSTHMDVP